MTCKSKRFKEIHKLYEKSEVYGLTDALEMLKKCPPTKFDQSVDLSFVTGVDPKKSDQHVRGTVSLPNGTGKKITILVLTSGEKADEATKAGADIVGGAELIEKIKGGWTEFDVVIATPDMMREVGKLGKVLGPRGLMPTPKAGTVTTDVKKAVTELKAGRIQFKIDRYGVIQNMIGKVSFPTEKLVENILFYHQALLRAKPSTAKGHYLKSLVLSTTMGPGIQIDLKELEAV